MYIKILNIIMVAACCAVESSKDIEGTKNRVVNIPLGLPTGAQMTICRVGELKASLSSLLKLVEGSQVKSVRF